MPEVGDGKTVRIILRGCELSNGELSDVGFNSWVILELCRYTCMTSVGDPIVRHIPPGLSCGLVIKESHMFLHTWPETASVRVVIDSCADFCHEDVAAWLMEIYYAADCEFFVV